MKKIIFGMIFLGICSYAFAGTAPGTIISETEVIVPKGKTMTQILYTDGKSSRTEMYEGKGSSKVLMSISIIKGDYMYSLMPKEKTGMKMSLKSQMAKNQKGSEKESPKCDKWTECVKQMPDTTITERGKEKWEGQEYTVYRVTDNKSKKYVDYYVDSKGMLKRWVSYDSKGNLEADMRLIRFETGKALPAGIFDIPSDYNVMDMSNMPMMPGMPH